VPEGGRAHIAGRIGEQRGGGESEEGEEVAGFAFVAEGESAAAEQPGQGGLDDPAVPAEALAGLDAGAGDPRGDAALAQERAQLGGVVGLVGVQLARVGFQKSVCACLHV